MPKTSCPAFWDLASLFLNGAMYIQSRAITEGDIRMHPNPKQEEIDSGHWVTGKDAIKEFCSVMSPTTLSRLTRTTQTYAIAMRVLDELGYKRYLEIKEPDGVHVFDFREVLTPDIIEPIVKLRVRESGQTWVPQTELQQAVLRKVLGYLFEFKKINIKVVKDYVKDVVGTKTTTERDNLKQNLQKSYGDEVREIEEIFRKDKPLLKDGELSDFVQKVYYTGADPLDLYIEQKFLGVKSKNISIPTWIELGFNEYLIRLDETTDQTPEEAIWAVLSKFLDEHNITLDEIKVAAKTQLKEQWGII